MARNSFDAIVVGVGGMGSAAVYHLAARGVDVLGLERYDVPHGRGSSHGETRIFRLTQPEHPDYVPLARRARELWRELEAESGVDLLTETGSVHAGPADGETVADAQRGSEALMWRAKPERGNVSRGERVRSRYRGRRDRRRGPPSGQSE